MSCRWYQYLRGRWYICLHSLSMYNKKLVYYKWSHWVTRKWSPIWANGSSMYTRYTASLEKASLSLSFFHFPPVIKHNMELLKRSIFPTYHSHWPCSGSIPYSLPCASVTRFHYNLPKYQSLLLNLHTSAPKNGGTMWLKNTVSGYNTTTCLSPESHSPCRIRY
jgi:hypothetical protein